LDAGHFHLSVLTFLEHIVTGMVNPYIELLRQHLSLSDNLGPCIDTFPALPNILATRFQVLFGTRDVPLE